MGKLHTPILTSFLKLYTHNRNNGYLPGGRIEVVGVQWDFLAGKCS